MRIILALVLALVTSAAWAGSFTVPTTVAQDDAIAAVVGAINANRAAEKPPKSALTELDYVKSVVLPMFDQWVEQRQAIKTSLAVGLLKKATDAKIKAAEEALK